jgi:hypothetical protein
VGQPAFRSARAQWEFAEIRGTELERKGEKRWTEPEGKVARKRAIIYAWQNFRSGRLGDSGAIPDTAGGEGGREVAKPDTIIHRYIFTSIHQHTHKFKLNIPKEIVSYDHHAAEWKIHSTSTKQSCLSAMSRSGHPP